MLKKLNERPGFAIFMQIFIFVFICILIASFLFNKIQIHQALNSCHSVFLDYFFQLITFLGDGIFAVIISILIFVFKDKKEGILLLLTFLVSALLAQLFKNFVFADFMRPLFYIQAGELKVETIKGLKMHLNHSFPSGHTTTIFAMCSMISFFQNSKKIGFFLILVAVITAYSRIYLSQHFLQDTLAGSLLGVMTSILIFYLFEKRITFKTNNSTEK